MNHEFQPCNHVFLFILFFSLIAINASALQIDYELIKGDFSYCKGQARQLYYYFSYSLYYYYSY